ncbi:hypothetical protein [Mesorhizobium sp.]|uniref:hypothetical protein n=1 Tax=Mesorhizobium sp. TaxID=1871066 RepID=UPI000FEA1A46|nr:hypothetical protein [Mesorhizobium sp.]RWC58558.1 MAG: hypothetical protein EOS29_23140 [Mesorhizobium sp.]RWC62162.1 MAG: hypothetical protein EOS56_09105 [Mesorhizobium sp.]
MVDENEAQALYDELITKLATRRDAGDLEGRDDFLAPILAEIEAGKAVPIKLKVPVDRETIDPVAGRRSSGTSSAEFIQRQEFSNQEKLEILLRGLELAIIAPARMAVELNELLAGLSVEEYDGVLNFGDDVASGPARTISPPDLIVGRMAASKLESLIKEIRVEALSPNEGAV